MPCFDFDYYKWKASNENLTVCGSCVWDFECSILGRKKQNIGFWLYSLGKPVAAKGSNANSNKSTRTRLGMREKLFPRFSPSFQFAWIFSFPPSFLFISLPFRNLFSFRSSFPSSSIYSSRKQETLPRHFFGRLSPSRFGLGTPLGETQLGARYLLSTFSTHFRRYARWALVQNKMRNPKGKQSRAKISNHSGAVSEFAWPCLLWDHPEEAEEKQKEQKIRPLFLDLFSLPRGLLEIAVLSARCGFYKLHEIDSPERILMMKTTFLGTAFKELREKKRDQVENDKMSKNMGRAKTSLY